MSNSGDYRQITRDNYHMNNLKMQNLTRDVSYFSKCLRKKSRKMFRTYVDVLISVRDWKFQKQSRTTEQIFRTEERESARGGFVQVCSYHHRI